MACEEMRLLVETYDEARDGHAALAVRDPKVGAYTVLGICLTALGYPDSGAGKSLEAVGYADSLNHQVSQIVALRRACVQHIMQRDTQTVLELSQRLLGLAGEFETFKKQWTDYLDIQKKVMKIIDFDKEAKKSRDEGEKQLADFMQAAYRVYAKGESLSAVAAATLVKKALRSGPAWRTESVTANMPALRRRQG